MRAALLCSSLLALGATACYSPKPPGGSYLCSTIDKDCPDGQSCECGLCVDRKTQAACGFKIDTAATGSTLQVEEHQSFSITITAKTANGTDANEFGGEVTLASTWGDVRPSKVTLKNGTATVDVRLNRETLSPQTARVLATFHGNNGQSGKIGVSAHKFARQAEPVVPPATPLQPFGWANRLIAQPNVLRDETGYRMYFVGVSAMAEDRSGVGVARSTDGKTWTPEPQPILITKMAGGGIGNDIQSPSVFKVGDKYHAVVSKGGTAGREIALGTSTDGISGWEIHNSGAPILKSMDCAYCNRGLDFPQVLPDPSSVDASGKASSWIMFFNATAENGLIDSVSIGRAQSTDGLAFTPEPAPLLSGDLTGEALLFSPRVLVDGTVFKMWYSFARIGEIANLLDLCDANSKVSVGYATSDDGFYWIRSPSNPVLEPGATGWDQGDRAILVSSVIPSDGTDPQNGIDLYYTSFRRTALTCLPNGIGKASRP